MSIIDANVLVRWMFSQTTTQENLLLFIYTLQRFGYATSGSTYVRNSRWWSPATGSDADI